MGIISTTSSSSTRSIVNARVALLCRCSSGRDEIEDAKDDED